MYDHKTGYNNEYNFVCLLNNKKIKELDPITKDMIYKIYNYNVFDNDIIKCWRNHYAQKGDILINVNGIIKSLSIKMGTKNSVHAESIHLFIEFLKENKIPTKIIKYYLEYHYADGTINGKGNKRLSVEEYKIHNQNKIDLINKYFSEKNFVLRCLDRFLLKGNNCEYKISGLIYGTPNDYIFLSRHDIEKLFLKSIDKYATGVHVGFLFIQPMARDLNYTGKYDRERNLIQIKWFNIFDEIMYDKIIFFYVKVFPS